VSCRQVSALAGISGQLRAGLKGKANHPRSLDGGMEPYSPLFGCAYGKPVMPNRVQPFLALRVLWVT
jgi:hypothetical protein